LQLDEDSPVRCFLNSPLIAATLAAKETTWDRADPNRSFEEDDKASKAHSDRREIMKSKLTLMTIVGPALWALAAAHTDFSGVWEFHPEKSRNVGMMTQMKMTLTIQQSDSSFDINSHANMQGQDYDTKTHYDLTGKPVSNEAPMSGTSETVSKWEGNRLVTTWTSAGAVAGSKVVRTETRALSEDGKIMTVESARGANAPLVMVFEKRQ
jgi:hypothetical protein